jgi:hypothetical protein
MEITESSVSPARGSVISAYGTISKIAKSRTVTVAIEAMNFRKSVFVGDRVSVHASLVKIGKTSIVPRSLGLAPQGNAFDPGD